MCTCMYKEKDQWKDIISKMRSRWQGEYKEIEKERKEYKFSTKALMSFTVRKVPFSLSSSRNQSILSVSESKHEPQYAQSSTLTSSHKYIHTYIYIHNYIQAYIQTYLPSYLQTYARKYIISATLWSVGLVYHGCFLPIHVIHAGRWPRNR